MRGCVRQGALGNEMDPMPIHSIHPTHTPHNIDAMSGEGEQQEVAAGVASLSLHEGAWGSIESDWRVSGAWDSKEG